MKQLWCPNIFKSMKKRVLNLIWTWIYSEESWVTLTWICFDNELNKHQIVLHKGFECLRVLRRHEVTLLPDLQTDCVVTLGITWKPVYFWMLSSKSLRIKHFTLTSSISSFPPCSHALVDYLFHCCISLGDWESVRGTQMEMMKFSWQVIKWIQSKVGHKNVLIFFFCSIPGCIVSTTWSPWRSRGTTPLWLTWRAWTMTLWWSNWTRTSQR